MTYINSYKNQDWLLPTSIKQMIPQNHISFFVEEFVESLDFSGFDMISDGAGHPSYLLFRGCYLKRGHQESLQELAEKTLFLCI